MVTLSDKAKKCLDKYLRQVRTYLRGCKAVDADDVERSVLEHIEGEFEGATAAVSFEELNATLQRLGSPQQWVPEEEVPWWRLIILRLRSGPEDWRLAYISLGLLIVGLLVLPASPACVVWILASFLVSRAALSQTEEPNELKAQKWLLYPSLIIVYAFVLLGLLTWPLWLLVPLAEGYEHSFSRLQDDLDYWVMATLVILAGLGLWWSILAAVFLKPRRLLRVLFRPFADAFRSKWALLLLLIGSGLMILSVGAGILYYYSMTSAPSN